MASLLFPPHSVRFTDPSSESEIVETYKSRLNRRIFTSVRPSSAASDDPTLDRRIGKPNSRRRRRYLNSVLSDHYTETEIDDSDEEEEPIYQSHWNGVFTQAGDDFFDNAQLAKQRRRKTRSMPSGPQELERAMFLRMGKRARTILRRGGHELALFVTELEALLLPLKFKKKFRSTSVLNATMTSFDVVFSPSKDKASNKRSKRRPRARGRQVSSAHVQGYALGFEFKDSFQRLVAHGVAAFHGLSSESESCDNSRVTFVRRPKLGAKMLGEDESGQVLLIRAILASRLNVMDYLCRHHPARYAEYLQPHNTLGSQTKSPPEQPSGDQTMDAALVDAFPERPRDETFVPDEVMTRTLHNLADTPRDDWTFIDAPI